MASQGISERNGTYCPTTRVSYLFGGGLTRSTAQLSSLNSQSYNLSDFFEAAIASAGRKINDSPRSYASIRNSDMAVMLLNDLQDLKNNSGRLPNLEDLVDILESSGIDGLIDLAKLLREEFADALQNSINQIRPAMTHNMATVIIDSHNVPNIGEELVGVITTNYDSLIEDAYGELGIKLDIGVGDCDNKGLDVRPLLKLHGSFDWTSTVPPARVKTGSLHVRHWIPPSRSKAANTYPFLGIWSRAIELLSKSQVVRAIGTSLYASDWHIVRLLYDRCWIWRKPDDSFIIECINSVHSSQRILEAYPMLPIRPMWEIPAVVDAVLIDQGIDTISDAANNEIPKDIAEKVKKYLEEDKRMANPTDYWLKCRAEAFRRDPEIGAIDSPSSPFAKYALSSEGGTDA